MCVCVCVAVCVTVSVCVTVCFSPWQKKAEYAKIPFIIKV